MPRLSNNLQDHTQRALGNSAPDPTAEVRIFRSAAPEPYTVLINAFLQANAEILSPEAIGVGAHLLSRPSNWNISIRMLQTHHGIGKEKIRAILRQLADAGYARRFAIRNAKGQLDGQYWVLANTPNHFGDCPNNHFLVYPPDRPENRPSANPSVGPSVRRENDPNKPTKIHKAKKQDKPIEPFPATGTIIWSSWGELARRELRRHGKRMPDVDFVAAEFRKWCAAKDIALDVARIEKTFCGFCQKFGPA